MPLVIKRSEGESVVLLGQAPSPVTITVNKRKGCVYLAIDAPREVKIVRGENLSPAPLVSGRFAS